MTPQAMIDLFQKHVNAELAGDLDTTMATMSDDPYLNNVPTNLRLPRNACSLCDKGALSIDHYSNCPHMKRPEFFAARFAEVAKNVDGVLVDHLAQLKKRLVWLQIHIGNLLSDLLGASEDSR